jgi:hypothetical protein
LSFSDGAFEHNPVWDCVECGRWFVTDDKTDEFVEVDGLRDKIVRRNEKNDCKET